jgi:hypothetical protein
VRSEEEGLLFSNKTNELHEIGIPYSEELKTFAKAVLSSNEEQLVDVRKDLTKVIGKQGIIEAAGIVAFFNAINRIADATGTSLDQEVINSQHYLDLSKRFSNKN